MGRPVEAGNLLPPLAGPSLFHVSGIAGIRARVPVITLWQPWASLCFLADLELRKGNETRGYPPPLKYVGGTIALHAAAAFPADKHISSELNDLCYDAFGCGYNYSLPRGCILGTVTLSGGVRVEEVRDRLSPEELAAGDYSDGRWVWPLSDPEPFAIPVPAKGKQGWWSIDAELLVPTPSPERQ